MGETFWIAIVTAVATVAGQWILAKAQHDKDNAVLNERLEGIKTRLDEHNNYASKIGGLADDMSDIKVGMAEIKTDVAWLKNQH